MKAYCFQCGIEWPRPPSGTILLVPIVPRLSAADFSKEISDRVSVQSYEMRLSRWWHPFEEWWMSFYEECLGCIDWKKTFFVTEEGSLGAVWHCPICKAGTRSKETRKPPDDCQCGYGYHLREKLNDRPRMSAGAWNKIQEIKMIQAER